MADEESNKSEMRQHLPPNLKGVVAGMSVKIKDGKFFLELPRKKSHLLVMIAKLLEVAAFLPEDAGEVKEKSRVEVVHAMPSGLRHPGLGG